MDYFVDKDESTLDDSDLSHVEPSAFIEAGPSTADIPRLLVNLLKAHLFHCVARTDSWIDTLKQLCCCRQTTSVSIAINMMFIKIDNTDIEKNSKSYKTDVEC